MNTFEVKNEKCGFQKQFAVDINGIMTDFVFHKFNNKWMLLVTQYGKLPSFYNVTFDVKRDHRIAPYVHGPVNDPLLHVSVAVTIICCMGIDSDEARGAIQFLINKTGLNRCPVELMIGLGLKKVETADVRAIAEVLEDFIFKALRQHKPIK